MSDNYPTADALLDALARLSVTHEVVSTGRLTPAEIDKARADGLLYVNADHMGFVLRPSPKHPKDFKYFDWACQIEGCQAMKLRVRAVREREDRQNRGL